LSDGQLVRVYDGTILLGAASLTGTSWTFTPATPLLNGSHVFTVVVYDAGRMLEGAASNSWGITVATAATIAGKLPHTGITASQCYQANSNTLVACSSAGALALNGQQDGHRADINAMSYSLVPNASGGNYSKEECVKDNVTGLIWEGKTASGFRAGGSMYTNLDVAYYGTQEDMDATTNTYGYVKAVNDAVLCGYADWRLPTADELQSIAYYANPYYGQALDATWFPNTSRGDGSFYWSSTANVAYLYHAWGVGFDGGYVYYNYRTLGAHVRLVRLSP